MLCSARQDRAWPPSLAASKRRGLKPGAPRRASSRPRAPYSTSSPRALAAAPRSPRSPRPSRPPYCPSTSSPTSWPRESDSSRSFPALARPRSSAPASWWKTAWRGASASTTTMARARPRPGAPRAARAARRAAATWRTTPPDDRMDELLHELSHNGANRKIGPLLASHVSAQLARVSRQPMGADLDDELTEHTPSATTRRTRRHTPRSPPPPLPHPPRTPPAARKSREEDVSSLRKPASQERPATPAHLALPYDPRSVGPEQALPLRRRRKLAAGPRTRRPATGDGA